MMHKTLIKKTKTTARAKKTMRWGKTAKKQTADSTLLSERLVLLLLQVFYLGERTLKKKKTIYE